MQTEDKGLNDGLLKKIAGDGVVEFCLRTQRSKTGVPGWELKIMQPNGTRRVVKISDYGFAVIDTEVRLNSFKNREERDKEIFRLYTQEHLSQSFLANLFNISQPSISVIIKKK